MGSLAGADPVLIDRAAASVVLIIAILVVLAGVEGFILFRSIAWWIGGFAGGLCLTVRIGGELWAEAHGAPPPRPIAAALAVAGILIGILAGRFLVMVIWMLWKAAVFLAGLGWGALLWLLLAWLCFADADRAVLAGGALLVGLGAGTLWLLIYRRVFPWLWFLGGALAVARPALRLILEFLPAAPGGEAGAGIPEADSLFTPAGWIGVAAWLARPLGGHRGPALAVLAASAAFVLCAMWAQRFPSRFAGFYDRSSSPALDRYRLLGLVSACRRSLADTLGSLVRLRRTDVADCLILGGDGGGAKGRR